MTDFQNKEPEASSFTPLRVTRRGDVTLVQYPETAVFPTNVIFERGEVIYADFRRDGKLHCLTGPAVVDVKADTELFAAHGESLGIGPDGRRRLNAMRVVGMDALPLAMTPQDLEDLATKIADDVAMEEKDLRAAGLVTEVEHALGSAAADEPEKVDREVKLAAIRSVAKRNPWAAFASSLLVKGAVMLTGLGLGFTAASTDAEARSTYRKTARSQSKATLMFLIPSLVGNQRGSAPAAEECDAEELAALEKQQARRAEGHFATGGVHMPLDSEVGSIAGKKIIKVQEFAAYEKDETIIAVCRSEGALYEVPASFNLDSISKRSPIPVQLEGLRKLDADEADAAESRALVDELVYGLGVMGLGMGGLLVLTAGIWGGFKFIDWRKEQRREKLRAAKSAEVDEMRRTRTLRESIHHAKLSRLE